MFLAICNIYFDIQNFCAYFIASICMINVVFKTSRYILYAALLLTMQTAVSPSGEQTTFLHSTVQPLITDTAGKFKFRPL